MRIAVNLGCERVLSIYVWEYFCCEPSRKPGFRDTASCNALPKLRIWQ